MRMKHRWIGGLTLAIVLSLAACAPEQGAGETPEASVAAVASAAAEPSETPEPMESAEASGTPEPTPDDYEY
jgi:hypothetical protein